MANTQAAFVLGFRPPSSKSLFRSAQGTAITSTLTSLLSKQLRPNSSSDAEMASSCEAETMPCDTDRASSESEEDDGLCCDDLEEHIYSEELAGGSYSAPIKVPIMDARRNRRRQRDLAERLEFLAQVDEMKLAAEGYTGRVAPAYTPYGQRPAPGNLAAPIPVRTSSKRTLRLF